MSAQLSDLLAVPALQGARLFAGDAHVDIRHVLGRAGNPRRVAVDLVYAEPDTLLVLIDPVDRFDTRFDVLLRRARQAGVAAVAFAGEGGILPGPGSAALAHRLQLALVAVPDPWEASIHLHEQLAATDAPAVRLTWRVAEVGLAAGPDVGETLRLLQDALGYPLTLLDPTGRTVAGVAELDDANRAVLATSAPSGRPVQLPTVASTLLIAAPVGTGIGARAWLASEIPRRLPAEADAVAGALQTASIAIGHRLALARLVDERDARYRTGLLDELRATVPTSPPELAQRAIAVGWRLDAWHVGIRIVPRNAADVIALRRDVERAFQAERIGVQIVEQDSGWAAWVSSVAEPSVSAIRALSDDVRRAMTALRSRIPSNVGIGSVQAGAQGLVRSLGEAADAARLAANRPETGYFVHIDTLGLAQLLLAWTQTDTFLPAARELLAPLNRVGGDLRHTLAVYLDSGASVTETAAILDLHRNTVANRIAQIQRLLGVDLGDPETRLALHLATRTLNEE